MNKYSFYSFQFVPEILALHLVGLGIDEFLVLHADELGLHFVVEVVQFGLEGHEVVLFPAGRRGGGGGVVGRDEAVEELFVLVAEAQPFLVQRVDQL